MKNLYLFLLITFSTLYTQAQNQPFITTWQVTASDLSITIPTHSGSIYNYTVDFGDGTVLNNQTGDATHTYNSAGSYDISITGTFPRIYFNATGDLNKITHIKKWGDIQWQSMESAFKGCFMVKFDLNIDTPDLSQVNSLSEMFMNANLNTLFNIQNWGVSNVTDMNSMFKNASFFGMSINQWDVSNVINMSNMFESSGFNSDISSWDVSNVTDMSYMFSQTGFNQPINNWNVSNVTNMAHMFYNCYNFDQPMNNWNVSSVTNMLEIFHGATVFNQDLSNWNVSNVVNMSYMFYECHKFNQPLNNWNVSNVTDMSHMFEFANDFNQPINNWDVSSVTDMTAMFQASDFNHPINNWDVSNVTNMTGLFAMSENFNQSINTWDVSSVTNMSDMFAAAEDFNQPIDSWDVSNVVNMSNMFGSAFSTGSIFNQPLNSWNVSNVVDMSNMFRSNTSFDKALDNWDVSNVTNLRGIFNRASSFNQPLDSWNIANVTSLKLAFANATSFNQPLDSWNASNVIEMDEMFYNATSFNQPLSNWNVSNVTEMYSMFKQAISFDQDLTQWSFNINVDFDKLWSTSDFLSNSGLSVKNYDKLLTHFATLQLNNSWHLADGLEYCNVTARNELINNQGWAFSGDSQSLDCNLITGNLLYDEANDGCTPTDIGINGFRINANDGNDDIYTYSSNGTFELNSIGTNFTVTVTNFPNYYSIAPASQQVTFTTSNTEVADFCVTANQSIEDLNVVLIPISEARPGFEADYQLVVENIGTQAVNNAIVTLDFDDAMQSFVNAGVTPTSTTANQLTFDINNLQPLTFQTIDLTMQTFQPPTVNGGDILSFTANVSPSVNDFTLSDNTFVYDQIVVNSYDPNDKQVLQGEEIEIDETDEYLNYLIRFQNTGTASAINIRILDTLHPKLDYSTLRPVNSSHDYRIEVTNENQVEFIFDGINLPDENTNEPASHGFVAYKIKPKSDVAVGDFIIGDANIYFDFNAPIITNMVSTEIIDNLDSVNYNLQNDVSIYPNPTKNILHIEVKNNQEIDQIKIYNLSGLELMNVKENQQQLNLEGLSAGVYLIQIQTNLGTVNKRFIKK